ncbi:MSHA biogenesis protein MshP [Motilimonas pumila]|uniref:MSHA biogenesis protein MshP n=2 Tax=Motilimonas pumila TaxID=2303987 RepID=A0A418YHY9_9GAMM|nr:MSHA biogenesis protein MshP [Motilimonas pumila]
MYPKRPNSHLLSLSLQGGSAIVIAVFIIVVMSLLAAALTRMLQDSQDSIAYEVYGTRAYLAANAGIEHGFVKLFPLGGGSEVCNSVTVLDLSAQTAFHGCTVNYSCNEITETAINLKQYRLESTAQCDAGKFVTRRKIQAQAKEL